MKALKHFIIATLIILMTACTYQNKNNTTANVKNFDGDLSKISALDFLKKLKEGNEIEYWCHDAPDNWVKKPELPYLIKCLDSNDVLTAPVHNKKASLTLGNHGHTTLAREAYFMISSFRRKYSYPPYTTSNLDASTTSVIGLEDSLKIETLNWWKSQ